VPKKEKAELPEEKPKETTVEFLASLAAVLVTGLFIITFVLQAFEIPSSSMENTLLIGDFLLVNKAVYSPAGIWGHLHILPYRNVAQDDVVVFHYPVDPSTYVVKRVIALPGDHIHLTDGRVWVNDRQMQEPFTIYTQTYPSAYRDNFPSNLYSDPGINPRWWQQLHLYVQNGVLTVPGNRYFVMGDNRNDSLDSRYWGYVPRRNIVGEPYLVYFSLRKSALPETSNVPEDRLTQGHTLWAQMAGIARWDRMFHVIR
jgi:signal peptidase I